MNLQVCNNGLAQYYIWLFPFQHYRNSCAFDGLVQNLIANAVETPQSCGVGSAVKFLVVSTISKEGRPPQGQFWMEQYLTLFKYWPN